VHVCFLSVMCGFYRVNPAIWSIYHVGADSYANLKGDVLLWQLPCVLTALILNLRRICTDSSMARISKDYKKASCCGEK
jgi:hypothetical protein